MNQREYPNVYGDPAGVTSPRGLVTAPPRYVSRTSQSTGALTGVAAGGTLADEGVTISSPGMRPAVGATVPPRTEATCHSPGGPSTRSVNGDTSERAAGQS